jgi:hypothetical protein
VTYNFNDFFTGQQIGCEWTCFIGIDCLSTPHPNGNIQYNNASPFTLTLATDVVAGWTTSACMKCETVIGAHSFESTLTLK